MSATEHPPLGAAPVSTFFEPSPNADAAYIKVDWGGEVHHVDSNTGAEVVSPDTTRAPARDTDVVNLRVRRDADGETQLMLERHGHADTALWRGNLWARQVKAGQAQSIAYTSADGTPLTGWLLYPPGYSPGRRLPIVTIVYPRMFSANTPRDFDILTDDFEHPQLFAALGYGVLLPSMPVAEKELQSNLLQSLTAGVLPLLDTVVARGIADSSRIALLGQSAGGYATLGLITQTHRFRSAIASGAYVDLTSQYGTFYGEYRYGDAGEPERGQLLRMLQFERGVFGADAAPWEHPERYVSNSPLTYVSSVHTPVMLVKGDADFVPVEQAEEFFTALYRQDRKVELVRYSGEGHTITARANVLDLWRRMGQWLSETMPP